MNTETIQKVISHIKVSASDWKTTLLGFILFILGVALIFIPKEYVAIEIDWKWIAGLMVAGLILIGAIGFKDKELTQTTTETHLTETTSKD
jgi:uncharacterized membrane protein